MKLAAILPVVCLAWAGVARAQDFEPIAPLRAPDGAAAFLEHGLAPARSGLELSASVVRWHGLPELETHAMSFAAAWRSLRMAAGGSRTGDSEIGWMSAAVAAGWSGVSGDAGAGVRGVARRDRPDARATSAEVGGGAWARVAPGVVLWAHHPRLGARGAWWPSHRGLEIGAGWRGRAVEAWVARATEGEGRGDELHRAGIAIDVGPVALAIELRERPLRLRFALGARAGVRFEAAADEHPVLATTTRLGIGWRPGSEP